MLGQGAQRAALSKIPVMGASRLVGGQHTTGMHLAASAAALAVLLVAACSDTSPRPSETSPVPAYPPRPEGHGELRWVSDVAVEGVPGEGLASSGYVLLIPMEAHNQWWVALGWGVQPTVDVEFDSDGRVISPYAMFQHIHDKVSRDLLDEVAEFGTVSEVSEHGYFREPTEPGLYWACVANDYAGLLWVSGCDIASLGEHTLVLTEHMGDVTATSENKDYAMGPPDGWSNIPGYYSSEAPEEGELDV